MVAGVSGHGGGAGDAALPPISVAGVGPVTLAELEARLSAYLNAGAPEPVIEGSPDEKRAILEHVARRGDGQMRSLVGSYLRAP